MRRAQSSVEASHRINSHCIRPKYFRIKYINSSSKRKTILVCREARPVYYGIPQICDSSTLEVSQAEVATNLAISYLPSACQLSLSRVRCCRLRSSLLVATPTERCSAAWQIRLWIHKIASTKGSTPLTIGRRRIVVENPVRITRAASSSACSEQ